MDFLISPESSMPIRIKAFFRWAVVKIQTKRGRVFEVTYYEENETAPELNAKGYIQHNGVTIGFINHHGGLRCYW